MSMVFQNPTPSSNGPQAHIITSSLPIPLLETLKFKANQIIDSIQSLQRTIEAGHQAAMPAWPDILNKYNILLSQTHSFSTGLVGNPSLGPGHGGRPSNVGQSGASPVNPLEKIALHPSIGMTDSQLDSEVIPLLRNQQTLDVLRVENETVRRLAEHMTTRGSLGVLRGAGPSRDIGNTGFGIGTRKTTEYEDVLRECEEIRNAHDRRVERAVRAVIMLRDKFDWKQRVEVEVEEPEELEWDPRIRSQHANDIDNGADGGTGDSGGENDGNRDGEDGDGDVDVGMDSPEGGSSDEDSEVQALVDSAMDIQSPSSALLVPSHSTPIRLVPGPIATSTSTSSSKTATDSSSVPSL